MVSHKRKIIDDLIYSGEENGTKNLTELTLILPSLTDTNPFFEITRAEQNISKKHRPANKETLKKNTPNKKDINNKITLHKTSILPLSTNLESTKSAIGRNIIVLILVYTITKKHHTKANKCR